MPTDGEVKLVTATLLVSRNANMPRYRLGLRCIPILVLFIAIAAPASQDLTRIHIESALVTVPVIVSDSQGRFLPGLNADAFKLYQDGISMPISLFLTSEDPIHIALLLDTSASTLTVLDKIRQAASRFLLQLRPEDLAMVMSFDTDVRLLCSFTSDQRKLNDRIKSVRAGGSTTRMRDAIDEVIQKRLKPISGRKAVVLLTDGQDYGSQVTAPDLLDTVEASGTLIYSIFYSVDPGELMKELTGITSRVPKTASSKKKGPYSAWYEREAQAAKYLEELSELSAGRFYRSDVKALDRVFQQISKELRSQYLLGFYPDRSKLDGNIHTLVVGVSIPDTVVRSRRSFRAIP